jgi:SAM-dependent methyltransferase
MRFLDKEAAILEAARGLKVLHLGCVGFADPALRAQAVASPESARRVAEASLHGALCRVSDAWGIDFCREAIDIFERLGIFSRLFHGNAEKLEEVDLEQTFDLIIVGDLIEHLSNPGRMLEGIKRFCTRDTRIILTTPHAMGLPNYLRFLLGRADDGPEHVMTFSARHLENLLERHGYEVEEMATCHQPHARKKGALFTTGTLFMRRFPRLGGTLYAVARERAAETGAGPH